jgi:hypothetical protein
MLFLPNGHITLKLLRLGHRHSAGSPLPVQGSCEGAWLRDRAPFFVVAMSPVVLARWRVN